MELFFTPAERAIAAFLSEAWARECKVHDEIVVFEDTDELIKVRRSVAKFQDAGLRKLQASAAKDEAAVLAEVKKVDLSGLPEEDIAQLFFVLGPTFVSAIIAERIATTSSPEDLRALAALTEVRHTLLQSFTTAA